MTAYDDARKGKFFNSPRNYHLVDFSISFQYIDGIIIEKKIKRKDEIEKRKMIDSFSSSSLSLIESKSDTSCESMSSTDLSACLSSSSKKSSKSQLNCTPVMAVVSHFKKISSSKTEIGTHFPSKPLSKPSSSYGSSKTCQIFRYKANFEPNGLSTLQFSIVMKKKDSTRYKSEKINFRVGIMRGAEMIKLGDATLVLTGKERNLTTDLSIRTSIPGRHDLESNTKNGKKLRKKVKRRLFSKNRRKAWKPKFFSDCPDLKFSMEDEPVLQVNIEAHNGGSGNKCIPLESAPLAPKHGHFSFFSSPKLHISIPPVASNKEEEAIKYMCSNDYSTDSSITTRASLANHNISTVITVADSLDETGSRVEGNNRLRENVDFSHNGSIMARPAIIAHNASVSTNIVKSSMNVSENYSNTSRPIIIGQNVSTLTTVSSYIMENNEGDVKNKGIESIESIDSIESTENNEINEESESRKSRKGNGSSERSNSVNCRRNMKMGVIESSESINESREGHTFSLLKNEKGSNIHTRRSPLLAFTGGLCSNLDNVNSDQSHMPSSLGKDNQMEDTFAKFRRKFPFSQNAIVLKKKVPLTNTDVPILKASSSYSSFESSDHSSSIFPSKGRSTASWRNEFEKKSDCPTSMGNKNTIQDDLDEDRNDTITVNSDTSTVKIGTTLESFDTKNTERENNRKYHKNYYRPQENSLNKHGSIIKSENHTRVKAFGLPEGFNNSNPKPQTDSPDSADRSIFSFSDEERDFY